ncbi:biotin-dependent carboxyltransferase [Siculibacillus lacustris]|uniref:Biotin-dependent carboxyltransferase n=1 Tax=Siculibacillus lacustris TaxID=1549641 RepID=A0A4Q9VY14_9HYPH|nr:biotin-dependent carboxyltransferase family protein [Siculibacillus lacustris]TBW40268.1 biotin-dependent carboxyltransferase [Siculibacillus lacustris]
MTALVVERAGPGVTIQDGGRHGHLRHGVTVAGPMDPAAFATVHAAVGNPPGAAAIEVSLGGLDLAARDGAVDLAVIAPGFDVRHDGTLLPSLATVRLEAGGHISLRPGSVGAWAYVAIAGRIALPPVLGSLATHTRSGLGGLDGRALEAGDVLPLVDLRPREPAAARLVAPWLDPSPAPIRVLLGPQDDHFAADQIAAFLARDWTVSPRSDRMAYALDGTPLRHAAGHDIVSDGVAHGAIQVPGAGLPFVLMADRQPTGGYPKIANVIGADLGRLAQLRPGASLRFQAVSLTQAVAARRALAERLTGGPAREAIVRTVFTSEFLLSCNLISTWSE